MPKKDSSTTSVDPLETILGYKLRRVSAISMAQLADSLKPFELTVTELAILYQLSQHPNSTSSFIGKRLSIKSANMAPLVVRLVDKGLIKGMRVDGRSQSLSLTNTGQVCLGKIKKLVDEQEAALSENLSEKELAQFHDILDRVLASLMKKK